ncbi:FliH/SctL family protein [Asaia spathodeae]|uniref:Flagellar assembly protein FliH n=1 Tax=Asaia spathodeae TaxID=657016 RepID=A0ABX2P6X3_9PROT|nr:hypothetical protein [Asaia spathodeae]GBR20753.1 hypothetical protein AA105894_2636 [Asaia spathodeae NBRC 105894]
MTSGFVPFQHRLHNSRTASTTRPSQDGQGTTRVTSDKTGLARRLTDFSVVPPQTIKPSIAEEIAPEEAQPDTAPPLISLSQDELDDLRRAAFDAGREEGRTTATAALEAEFAEKLSAIAEAFEAERRYRTQSAREAGQVYVQTVIDLLVTLTHLPAEALKGVERDLLQDAADLIELCEEDVIIYCDPKDEARLKPLLGTDSKARFEPCAKPMASTIRIDSGTRSILIDPTKWRQSAIDRIMTSVSASIDREILASTTMDRH